MEELYRELRLDGAVVTRLDRPPALEPAKGRVGLRFFDPILAQEVLLTVERLIYDPPLGIPEEIRAVGPSLSLLAGPDHGPSPDNVLFPPPLTSRTGVFAVGRGLIAKDDQAGEELELLVEELGLLLGNGGQTQTATRLASDRRECALCLTCLRTCPVQAIGWDSGPVVLRVGLPELRPVRRGLPGLHYRASVGGGGGFEGPAPGAAILPAGSGLRPGQRRDPGQAPGGGPDRQPELRRPGLGGGPFGPLGPRFRPGAWVAACHPGNCRSLTGSARAGKVVAAVQDLLKPLGLPASTVLLCSPGPPPAPAPPGRPGGGGGEMIVSAKGPEVLDLTGPIRVSPRRWWRPGQGA